MVQELKWSTTTVDESGFFPKTKKRRARAMDRMAPPAIILRYSATASEDVVRSAEPLGSECLYGEMSDGDERDDDIGTARGILMCLAVSAVMWAMLWLAVRAAFA